MIFGDAIKPDGLTISITRAINLEEWTEVLEIVAGLSTASPWWIGDILANCEMQFGEKYAQVIPEGTNPSTLRTYQWVSSQVPPANRHPGLSWSHHRAVAALDPVEQSSLLDQAEAEGWGVRELATRAKGLEPKEREKARVFKVDEHWSKAGDKPSANGIIYGSLTLTMPNEEVLDAQAALWAGKRVMIEI
jgi:hypothetical protein